MCNSMDQEKEENSLVVPSKTVPYWVAGIIGWVTVAGSSRHCESYCLTLPSSCTEKSDTI